MTTILVTGGQGFIGRSVVAQLEANNFKAKVLDLPGGDIRDAPGMIRAMDGCAGVIHMAGVLGTHELFDTPQLAVDCNVTGTLNVLEACRHHGAAFVGITMPQVFPSIYTATKTAATRLASAYHHTHHVAVSHVRAFNAYGPGQAHGEGHPQKIIPTFAVNAWAGRPIPVWGYGTQTVDLIHVDDIARMLVDCLAVGGDDYTVDGGTGIAQTVTDVVETVCEIVVEHDGPDWSSIEFLPMRRGEIPTHIVATGEGWDRLKWKPREPDLADTVLAYRSHVDAVAA